ncbi:MAG: 30S ribosome-binding factor RbfA [Candidatus Sumerlaeia bacterium]|nr:30S ribosome-binding factor RbfA [Candidatus Sumerlaeia bacterium]
MLHSRIQRINHLIRNAVGEILLNDLTDPRLGFVTVAHVEVSKDLQSALVFVSVLSDKPEDATAALDALENAKGYIKSLLAQRVVLKFLPDLKFRLHEGAKHAARIDRILRDIAAKKNDT